MNAVNASTGEQNIGPTARRMILGSQLRRLREEAGITRQQAGYNIRGTGVDAHAPNDEVVLGARLAAEHPRTDNHGTHIIHTGPEHLSYLKLPVVETPH